jgi:hypothetical protein
MDSPQLTSTISDSDFGSSASNFRGPRSTYNTYPSSPRRFQGSYAVAPSTVMSQPYYTSYAPSGTTYSGYSSGAYQAAGPTTERTYFSLNGKLVRSYKVRSYRRAQKHVLDLFPDMLQGIASSRIQFFVIRPGYSRGRYVGLRSYISKNAWPTEINTLQEHETIGIEVRPSVSFAESVASFFNRSRVL